MGFVSVRSLEAQLSEAEAECTRLSKALDAQKQITHEIELSFQRRLDDATKEINSHVRCLVSLYCVLMC